MKPYADRLEGCEDKELKTLLWKYTNQPRKWQNVWKRINSRFNIMQQYIILAIIEYVLIVASVSKRNLSWKVATRDKKWIYCGIPYIQLTCADPMLATIIHCEKDHKKGRWFFPDILEYASECTFNCWNLVN